MVYGDFFANSLAVRMVYASLLVTLLLVRQCGRPITWNPQTNEFLSCAHPGYFTCVAVPWNEEVISKRLLYVDSKARVRKQPQYHIDISAASFYSLCGKSPALNVQIYTWIGVIERTSDIRGLQHCLRSEYRRGGKRRSMLFPCSFSRTNNYLVLGEDGDWDGFHINESASRRLWILIAPAAHSF